MKINIIGNGNVGSVFSGILRKTANINVYVRGNSTKDEGLKEIALLDVTADLTIICVNDDAICQVADFLPQELNVIHTSGSVSLDVLKKFKNYGVIYPLQTLSKERIIDLRKVPFLLEGSDQEFLNYLSNFCSKNISEIIHFVDSESRKRIHLAAVIANNFTTYLLSESANIVKKQGLSQELLRPLMEETVAKFFELNYSNAQTGPAKRNDSKTIKTHLDILKGKDMAIIYDLLSKAITAKFNS
jgi:predicted short-subunit dehydrogenase-like oxidoreductase (DUF2520 family)